MGTTSDGTKQSIHALWNRRQCTKFNGASFPVQRAAAAVYSDEGKQQIEEQVGFYMNNAKVLREGLTQAGFEIYGGINAPYVWLKTPEGTTSWDFFDKMLGESHIVGTPGSGFGAAGEGYFRLSAFNSLENTQEAVKRIKKAFA